MSHQFNTQAEHDAYVDERKKSSTLWSIIMASSLGTLIEWYDFYIYGSLAVVLSTIISNPAGFSSNDFLVINTG